jgi:hypothetical protein
VALPEYAHNWFRKNKMDNATTKAVVDSFSAVLNREPAAMRKTMTYDQGREMHGHERAVTPIFAQGLQPVDLLPGRTRRHRPVAQYAPKSQAGL